MIEVVFALLMYMNGKLEGYSPKANVADVYTKSTTDMLLGFKANGIDMTTALNTKANTIDVNSSLAFKANSTDV